MSPKRHREIRPAAACLLPLLAGPGAADDTWLFPEAATAKPGEAATFDLTSGSAFPANEVAVMPNRVEKAACRVAGKTAAIDSRRPGGDALLLAPRFAKAGLAVCWVSLFPKLTELTPDVVQEYLDEIAAPAAVRQAWMAGGKPGLWRELYTKHAKSFLRVGEGGAEAGGAAWSKPVGTRLEILIEKDPTSLHPNDEVAVRLLFQGKPLAGNPIGLVRAGEQGIGFLPATDGQGRSSFRVGGAGRYLLRATFLRRSTAQAVDWESDFATLTFEAK